MARSMFNLEVLGDKELDRILAKLPDKVQARAIAPALRASNKRFQTVAVQKLSGFPVQPQTGRLLIAMAGQQIAKVKMRRELGVKFGLKFPEREQLGIDPKDKYFYPAAVEYGHIKGKGKAAAPPRSYLRAAVDENLGTERQKIAQDIKKRGARIRK